MSKPSDYDGRGYDPPYETRCNKEPIPESQWMRSVFASLWRGPDIELLVLQNGGSSEGWQWTARGWREPDGDCGADKWGWVETASREDAEKGALAFYLEKDE